MLNLTNEESKILESVLNSMFNIDSLGKRILYKIFYIFIFFL